MNRTDSILIDVTITLDKSIDYHLARARAALSQVKRANQELAEAHEELNEHEPDADEYLDAAKHVAAAAEELMTAYAVYTSVAWSAVHAVEVFRGKEEGEEGKEGVVARKHARN